MPAATQAGATAQTGATRGIRRRRRGAALEEAILDAAWDELQDVGYAGFTIDAVARRAGTSRPVLYRRWPSRAQLVLAAVRAHVPSLEPADFPDTGQLRGDLLAALALMRDRYDRVGPGIMNGLATELAQLPAEVLDFFLPVTAAIAARAAGRGEIGTYPVPAHVLAVPQVLLRHELGLLHHRPTDAELAQIVDDVAIPAIRHASRRPPGRTSRAALRAEHHSPAGRDPRDTPGNNRKHGRDER